jgi:sodium-dependent dicarboxylate transporter 2/3/5
MSNTATTAMLFPLGLAVLSEIGRGRGQDAAFSRYAMAMMLGTSFAASIGGVATPVGTPPNLIGKGFLQQAGVDVTFADWMLLCVPIVIVMMAFVVGWIFWPAARDIRIDEDARQAVRHELVKLGRFSVGERFLLPVNWRARQFTMTWEQAARIDWGIILLFGGGLAMGRLADSSGLSAALGQWVMHQFPGMATVGLTVVFTAIAILISEAASNTAAANIIVPLAIAVSKAAGISAFEPAMGATLGASMGFMMPISTPPNAIVYSSGYIPIGSMIRHGLTLDLAGFAIIVTTILTLGALIK